MTHPRSWRSAFLRIATIIGLMLTPLLMTQDAFADTTTSGAMGDGSTWSASNVDATGAYWIQINPSGTISDTWWYAQFGSGTCSPSTGNCWINIGGNQTTPPCNYNANGTRPPPYSTPVCMSGTANHNLFSGGVIKVAHCTNQQPGTGISGTPQLGTTGCVNSLTSTPWCATTDYQDIGGSYVGTTLTVRFKWGNTTKPPAGWTIVGPDPGSSTGSSGTVPLSATVDGYPGYYSSTFTVSSDTAMTARLYAAPDTSSNPGCYVSLTLSSNAISVNPNPGQGDTGSDTQTSTNPNCGWSLNPFHYLKCLFEPSSSLQQWNDLESTAKTHPPISLVIGGVSYINTGIDVWTNGLNSCGVGGGAGPLPLCAYTFDGPDGNGHANLIQAAADYMATPWGQIVYFLEQASIGGFFIWRVWAIIAASMGTKAASE